MVISLPLSRKHSTAQHSTSKLRVEKKTRGERTLLLGMPLQVLLSALCHHHLGWTFSQPAADWIKAQYPFFHPLSSLVLSFFLSLRRCLGADCITHSVCGCAVGLSLNVNSTSSGLVYNRHPSECCRQITQRLLSKKLVRVTKNIYILSN